MIMFLVICKEVRYAAEKEKLDLQDPKIKKAMCYSVQKKLNTVLLAHILTQILE